jgi:RNA polymerase sigma factor (sigma-70 family)
VWGVEVSASYRLVLVITSNETSGMRIRERLVNDHFSTHDLLVRLQNGDFEAVGILFTRHAKEFYDSALKSLRSNEDAHEAVSATFEKLIKAVEKNGYDPVQEGGSHWLWKIFHNAVRDIQRKKSLEQRRMVRDELTDELIVDGLRSETNEFDPVMRTLDLETQETIERAIQLLPEEERREFLQSLQDGRKRGPKRASLRRAEEHLLAIYYELKEKGFSGDP